MGILGLGVLTGLLIIKWRKRGMKGNYSPRKNSYTQVMGQNSDDGFFDSEAAMQDLDL